MSESKYFGGGSGKSRFEQMAAQFQQKQMQEKEQKLLQMIDNQQQRAMQKANLSGVIPSKFTTNTSTMKSSSSWSNNTQSTQSRTSPVNPIAPGKVRQMFEERRKGGGGPISNGSGVKAGIDKSYPLDPLVVDPNKSKTRSVSSKSDPNPNYPNRVTRPPPVPHSTSKSVRQLPNRLTPTPPNLGSSNRGNVSPRGISLDRNNGSRNSSGASSNSSGPRGLGPGMRRSSSGFSVLNNPQDENGNELSNGIMTRSTPSPVIPKTTKYKDYVASTNGTVESRENSLGVKMRQLNISSPQSSSGLGDERDIGSANKAKASPTPSQKKASASRVSSNKSTSSTKSNSPTKLAERSGPPPGSVECRVCHRYFVSDRITKHESICKSTSAKKRKVFDPTKMRLQGTEAEPYLRQVSGKGKKSPVNTQAKPAKKADWRKKHEEFINTIRAAKVYQQHVAAGGNPADLPPPPPSDTSDYIQCPHCKRKFNEAAANRHIPKCQSIKSNKR